MPIDFQSVDEAPKGASFDFQPIDFQEASPPKEEGFLSRAGKTLKTAANDVSLVGAIPGAVEAFAGGLGEMGNAAVSGLYGPAKSLFTGKSAADEIEASMAAIRKAIPYEPETKSGKALLGILGIIPEGLHAAGETTYEKTGSPLLGAGVEALGNAALLGLPMAGKGKVLREPLTVKEKIDAVRAERAAEAAKANIDFISMEDAKGTAADKAIPPEVRAAQETLNAQDTAGAYKPAAVEQDLSAQRKLPFTNENLPNKTELQGDLFGDQRPLERAPEQPIISPNISRAAADAAKSNDVMLEEQARFKEVLDKQKEIEQSFQSRAADIMDTVEKTGRQEALQRAKDLRDIQLGQLEEKLRSEAYRPPAREMRVPRGQRGSVNLDIFDPAFEKVKELANGIKLLFKGDENFPTVTATRDGKEIGRVQLNATDYVNPTAKSNLTATWTDTKGAPKQGLAPEMYKFAAEQGDVVPAKVQTGSGKAMWDRFEKTGLAMQNNKQGRVIPRGQRGAAPIINDLAGAVQDRAKAINDILKENFFTPNMEPKDIIAKAVIEKDSGSINNLEAGGTLASMKRKSTIVTEGVRVIQTAIKKAELNQRTVVHPARTSLKKLSKQEIIDLGEVFKLEMFEGHKLTPEQMLGLNLSEKQMKAYADVRDMFTKALDEQNASRVAKGEEPITSKEAYLSSRWKGDFRRPVYAIRFAEDGKTPIINKSTGEIAKQLVYYLAADSKMGLESQYKALKKQFPELEAGKDHTVKSLRGGSDPKAMLSTAIDLLGRDDPAVARIREWAEEQTVAEGSKALGQEKHFETKHNVRGFVGDRPGRAPKQEAIDMFQEQLNYADNAFKWAELQKVADQLKEITNNPELLEKQPNNVAYLQDYARNHMGMGEAQWIKAAEDAIRSTGMSPHVIAGVVGGMKTLFILQKLAVSAGFSLANVIQYVNNIPHLVDISKNPLEIAMSATVGIPAGMAMATGHYLNARGTSVYQMVGAMPNGKFLVRAMKYFEDNGGTSRSILDESPVGHSFSVLGKAENIAGQTLAIPETYLRSTSFMTYVQLLKNTGKFTNDLELFRHAEERVNAAMGDYRQGEKALMFSKLGTMGNALNTLQTYPMNWYQQLNYFGREAGKGNVLPVMSMLATQYVVAGAMGIPGFNDTSKLWEKIKEWLPDNAWDKVKDVSLPGLVLQAGGESSLYGPLSTKTGVAMTSRVTAPGAGEMLTSPAGPAIDIAKQVGSLASLAGSPMDKDAQAQAVMNSIPTGLQGLMETGPLRNQTSVPGPNNTRVYGKATDVAAHKGMYARSPEEETLRKFGLRSQNEVFAKDRAYEASKQETDARKRAGDLTDKIYASARQGNQERTQELISLYERLLGKDAFDKSMQKQVMDEYTTAVQRTSMGAKTVPGLIAVKKMQEFFKERQNAN